MSANDVYGYKGKILRVDLTSGRTSEETLDQSTARKWVGGTGIGIKYMYDEVPPGVEWSDPENRLVMASGPVGGTIGGTGTFSVVTKGPMTNGCVSSQASGYMGAFMKFAGFDGIIIQGSAKNLVYLYLHGGKAELRDASYLAGKDTWETAAMIEAELGKKKRQVSVFAIGPAGENLVKFAAIVGDEGHVVAHGGVGAVMGSKKLKAVVAERGVGGVSVKDKARLGAAGQAIIETSKAKAQYDKVGTSMAFPSLLAIGFLPIKNYTTNLYNVTDKMLGSYYRPQFNAKRNPCWACQFNHCNLMKITEGPYAGFEGEEPEYECLAAMGPLIGQSDVASSIVLSDDVDRLGMDVNETGWLIAWLMECYEKGLLTKKDTDGIEMTWGNVEATRAMLRNVAHREGLGNLLAEGVMRAANSIGGEAANLGIYTRKGNTPRTHDHRRSLPMVLDTCVSDMGTDEVGLLRAKPESLGLPPDTDPLSPEGAASLMAAGAGKHSFEDSLVMCRFVVFGSSDANIVEFLNAATGWDFTLQEKQEVGLRIFHLMKAFNARHGHTPDLDMPSPKYASSPTDGPATAKPILPVWDHALRSYYKALGWDAATGRPLANTLKRYGLEYAIAHMWP